MAEISGGGMSFTSTMDNSQLDKAVEETLRRLQGLSEGAVAVGDAMDSTTAELVEQINIQKKVIQDLESSYNDLNDKINSIEPGTAQDVLIEQANAVKQELEGERQGMVELTNQLANWQSANTVATSSLENIRSTLSTIGAACEMNENAIASLEDEYLSLNKAMDKAFGSGNDAEYRALKQKADAIKGEITVRKQLLKELHDQSNALEESAGRIEQERQAVEQNANAHVSLRQRIKELKAEMADYRMQFGDQTEEYRKMAAELGNLQDIQGDIRAQGSILSNDENQFAGILSGLNGVVGGFAAAQGAVALFAGENENLQKIMVRVQSAIAMVNGLQQVAQTLNKDSAFSLVTLNGLKEWWNKLTGQSVVAETAEATATAANTAANTANAASQTAKATAATGATTATGANTAATGTNTVVAGAGTVANWSLAASFRAIGAAIKSIPVFGWVIAGISALIALVSHFVSQAEEAKKKSEEWYNAIAENSYKPIASVEELSQKWQALGDNLEAKKQFIEDNKKAFDELGVSVRDVTDAEKVLVSNKQAFIDAQIEKAKASLYLAETQAKIKEYIQAEQEYKAMPDKTSTWVQTTSFGTGYYVEGENTAKKEKKKALDELRKEITTGYTHAAEAEKAGMQKLHDAGISATKTYSKGSLGAIQQAIQLKQEALKTLTNNGDYKKAMKEIEDLQKQADKITGEKHTSGGSGGKSTSSTNTKDPFLAKLEKYKAEYTRFTKWINSGDSVIQSAASKEFAGLLKQGASYIDYLKRQREQILSIGVEKRTKEQNANLRKLNDAIAEETKKTVLETFNNELSQQLGNAKSIAEMLNVIEQRRKQLKNDNTEVDNGKKDALDNAEKDVVKKQKERTQKLLDDYASYTTKKLKLEQEYVQDMMLLQKQLDKAQTPQEKGEITKAMANRRVQYDKDNKGSGDDNYDALKEKYRTFQEKVTAIKEEYEEKRRVATLHNDTALLNQLATAEANELSKLQSDLITHSTDWQRLFGNLDELSSKSIKTLIKKIESQKIQFSGEFNPEDLKAINDQLEKARETIEKRNPFKALGNAFKQLKETIANNKLLDDNDPFVQELKAKKTEYDQYQEYVNSGNTTLAAGADQAFAELLKSGSTYLDYLKRKKQELQGKIEMGIDIGNSMQVLDAAINQAESGKSKSDMMRESLKETFSSAASSISFVKGCFDSVTDGIKKMGVQMDEETEAILSDIGGMMDGASQFAEGYATMNPLQMVQGTVGFLSSAFDLFNSRDRKAEKSIRKHKKAIEDLKTAYEQLEWAVDKALGSEVYTNQKAMIQNMKEQQEHLRGMINDENSKKHTDSGKIKEYKNQIAELDRQIQDMYDSIAQDILQTDAKTFADTLGDALVEAFGKGEDAAKAFDTTVNDIMKNAVLNQLKKNFLEKQLQGALDKLQADMGYWNGDTFIFDGLTDAEKAAFKNQVKGITAGFEEAMKVYEDLFKDVTDDGAEADTSLTGSVKGVSEETASQVSGQMNAIRINQMEATEILRQQLAALSTIAKNTAYNFHLAKLDRIVTLLESSASDSSLRSQGLS